MTQNVFRYTKKIRKLTQVTAPQHRDLITREYRGRSTNHLPCTMSLCYYHENKDQTGPRHYGMLLVLDETGLSIFAEGLTPVFMQIYSIRELSKRILKLPWHFCDAQNDGSYTVNVVNGRWEDEQE